MSLLTSPRIQFVGSMSWDPGLANNNRNVFDSQRVEVRLPPGITNETFPEYLIENLEAFGIWNLYGSHDAKFEHYPAGPHEDQSTRVTGGRTQIGTPTLAADPLVGKPLSLRGKLVDLDPEAVWNSQLYFDQLGVGDGTVGFTARRFQTMHSRWINFRRNLGGLDIAGGAGVVWQTVFPAANLEFRGVDQSPLLRALKESLEAPGACARGVILRFASYRTLYFQNGILNAEQYQPRSGAELKALHKSGKHFGNPAYSRIVGSIGIWNEGEPTTWPGGRFLTPAGSLPTDAGLISFGPAVAELHAESEQLVVDLLHAVPERDRDLDKFDLGNLIVAVHEEGKTTELGRIAPADYGRVAYERNAGIVEIPIDRALVDRLKRGLLLILGVSNGTTIPLLREEVYQVVDEMRDRYLHQGEPASATVRVFERGVKPAGRLKVVTGRYLGLARSADPAVILDVDAAGNITMPLQTTELGPADYVFRTFPANEPPPQLPAKLDITAAQYLSTRVLPTDDALEQSSSDAQLTWQFVYNNILRNWDLTNPVMSLRGLPLSDQAAMEASAATIKKVIDAGVHESIAYMPITRDLSRGKRRLLQRWADLQ